MAKHATSDNESEATSPKRARKDTNQSSLPPSSPPALADSEPQQDEPSEDEGAMDEEEDEEQQARATQKVREMQKKKTGLVGMAGIIEQVHLENFMSHRLTTVNFGPQINFINGNNGSGKSAILTAITMALGGNAKLTNRGSKGSSFVREGSTSAKATVRLKNQGSDAYQHDVYGNSITIERTMRAAGGGSYKIQNADGVTVDTKKTTLDAILDHFAIQVDNPMTVLSQDQSRQFLSSSSAKDKYNFFLRGTQLHQLTEEYEAIQSNVEHVHEALHRKKQVLPELREAYLKAKNRAKEAEAAINQQEKLEKLQSELVWSYVDESEDTLKRAKAVTDKEKARAEQIEKELEKFQAEKDEAEAAIRDFEDARIEAQNSKETIQPELDAVSKQVTQLRQKALDQKDHERTVSTTLNRLRETIKELDGRIADERKKLERDVQAEHKPILDEIARLEDRLSGAETTIAESIASLEGFEDKKANLVNDLDEVKGRLDNAHAKAQEVQGRIHQAQAAKKDNLLAYDRQMPNVVRDVRKERWRDAVLGPIGSYVKVNHPEYSRVLDSFFARTLNGFIVTNGEDRQKLQRLLNSYKVGQNVPIITVNRDDRFFAEVSSGEPDGNILTVRRALTIHEPLVDQALIIGAAIEKSALVKHRPDGDELLMGNPRNVNAAYSADCFTLRNHNGQSSSTVMEDSKNARLNPDNTGRIRAFEAELATIHQHINEMMQEKNSIDQALGALHKERGQIEATIKRARHDVGQLQRRITAEKEKLREEEPTNIGAIEDMRNESQAEFDSVLAQYEASAAIQHEASSAMKPAVERKGVLEKEMKAVANLYRKIESKVEAAVAKRIQADSSYNQFKMKLEEAREKHAGFVAKCQELAADLETRVAQASGICERPQVEKKRQPTRIQTDIDAVKKALKERERRQGASIEQIMQELVTRKATLAEAIEATNKLSILVQALGDSLQSRIIRWADFRDVIASRCKIQFLFHLSNRGFTGRLVFDHEKTALHVRVQTEETNGTNKGQQYKESRSLSGGEKSFSTVCLLLTMWEAVGCPIRCLDEFDVFMDAVNRRVAMKMMIDTAKAANSTQFLLITPNDMGNMSYGPEVRINKLADPARNQGNLAMGRR